VRAARTAPPVEEPTAANAWGRTVPVDREVLPSVVRGSATTRAASRPFTRSPRRRHGGDEPNRSVIRGPKPGPETEPDDHVTVNF
ncbi:MAG TPA: hypothetical protein VE172_18210, partial [Stackebrandtia sp.]|uniref:hypothetical protein n=1 Tax=Stackebrandtia sp. TaxID=2023065 RepID=UPI002D2D347F